MQQPDLAFLPFRDARAVFAAAAGPGMGFARWPPTGTIVPRGEKDAMQLIRTTPLAGRRHAALIAIAIMAAAAAGADRVCAQSGTAADSVAAGAPALVAAADPGVLTDAESGDWLQWLHSLEQSVTGRTAAGQEEAGLLFPLDAPAWNGVETRPYRHLAIAKAVGEVEAKGGPRGEAAARSPLLALSHARNYMHLSEYDSALTWYAETASLDEAGHFRRETGREVLAAAICARDSSAARRAVERTLAAADFDGREGELILAIRWLLDERDSRSLETLLNRSGALADPRVVFWRSYALSWLGRRAESLVELRSLLALGGLSRGLNERERTWVLVAVPDLLLLQGSPTAAAGLYERLANSELQPLRTWGQLQSAGLAFADNRYATAAAGYRSVCENDRQGAWGVHACAMADLADQMNRLLAEGERYGAAAQYRR